MNYQQHLVKASTVVIMNNGIVDNLSQTCTSLTYVQIGFRLIGCKHATVTISELMTTFQEPKLWIQTRSALEVKSQ